MDQRIDRSRTALKQALFKLLRTRTYSSVTVEEVAQCAGVSRSTFYVHFKGKDALLSECVSGMTGLMSQLALEVVPQEPLIKAMDHFLWAGDAALALMTSEVRPIIAATLATQIDSHFRARGLHRRGRLLVPSTMLSAMLAEAILAGVRAWMSSSTRLIPTDFANVLARQVGGMINASFAGAMAMRE